MPMDAMFMDDPPDVNCRAKSYSAADHLIKPGPGETRVQSLPFSKSQTGREGPTRMNWKRLILGALTALAMMAATYALPRGGTLREVSLAQFPMTVGVWAIFVLLFVKLK
jgi:hypothetical protein